MKPGACRRRASAAHRVLRLLLGACALLATPIVGHAIDARTLGVVVNLDDPLSVAIGRDYVAARGIAAAHVFELHLGAPRAVLAPDDFRRVWEPVRARLPDSVQGLALAWPLPYRVGCMSVTTAFAIGYGTRFCAQGCKPTAPNPLFNRPGRAPWSDYRVRPAMLVAATTPDNARQLIARGVRSDGLRPRGRAYLVQTPDRARSTRAPRYPLVRQAFAERLPVELVESEGLRDRFDILFYFTGAERVPYLDRLGFLPGAVADHLTSAGGQLDGRAQMSALRWLEAGATGSYGTVVEPCNFPQKFPDPATLLHYYLQGETLLEAYWKSVVWPGQGVFIGEPLAAPFAENPWRPARSAPARPRP